MNKDYKQIIKDTRIDHDLKQSDVATLLGCSKQNYSQIENGKITISIEQLVKLASHYHVSANYLLGLSKDKKATSNYKKFNYSNVINRIVLLRKENQLSQEYIAKEVLNISQSMYSRIENQVHHLDVLSLMKLSAFYNVTIGELLK